MTAVVLPEPDGAYAVGMRRFELTDSSRHGVMSMNANEPRVLPGYVWYPAAEPRARSTRPYLTAAEAAEQGPSMARNFGYGAHELDGLDRVITHSAERAPPRMGRERFPILIFSHGYDCYPAQNTALSERLASHGYIVISIAHPHDAVDLRLTDGTVLATASRTSGRSRFTELRKQLTGGPNHEARTAVVQEYSQALMLDRIGASLRAWRDDTLFVAHAIQSRRAPADLAAVLAMGDTQRIGFIGMSFGGATAASSCKLLEACRVVVNFDGGNYDPALFNAPVERPMLLMMSDWIHLPLPGRASDPAFHPNDYAYEPWSKAGLNPDIVRLWVDGIRHMGYTDLTLLMPGEQHDARFGTLPPRVAIEVAGAASLAFLNQYLKGGSRRALDEVIERTPVLHTHTPDSVRHWALNNF